MGDAQLITPEGKTIVLPEHIYSRVMEMLVADKPPRPMTREEIAQVIRETRGKYAGKKSMTKALLEIRREERALEEAKDARYTKLFKRNRPAKKNTLRVR